VPPDLDALRMVVGSNQGGAHFGVTGARVAISACFDQNRPGSDNSAPGVN
jgi:hypothetical protein